MKFLIVLSLCSVMMLLECSPKNDANTENPKPQVEKNMSESLNYKNESDGIKYSFKAEVKKAGKYDGIEYKNDFVQVEYELNNTSDKDYLVFNRGHFGTNSYTVYVEPGSNGTVEISQKAFREPTDKNCPQRFVAISPKASWLKAGQKITEKVEVEMPLQARTPFDDCEPKTELPSDYKKAKFCIGVLEADSAATKINDDGTITGLNYTKTQKLLCSNAVDLR